MKWNFRNCLIWKKKKRRKQAENKKTSLRSLEEFNEDSNIGISGVLEELKKKKKVNRAENKVQRKNGLKFLKFEIW